MVQVTIALHLDHSVMQPDQGAAALTRRSSSVPTPKRLLELLLLRSKSLQSLSGAMKLEHHTLTTGEASPPLNRHWLFQV
jgi:hypothetical protein